MSDCPSPGCPKQTPASMFACRKHWFTIPVSLRNEVNAAWRARLAGRPGATQRHMAAKRAAEAALVAAAERAR